MFRRTHLPAQLVGIWQPRAKDIKHSSMSINAQRKIRNLGQRADGVLIDFVHHL
jgi:hypothetical protein